MKKILTLLCALSLLMGCSEKNGRPRFLPDEQTLILYFPYSGLAGNIYTNLDELYEVWEGKIPARHRILVYLSGYDKTQADLFDLMQWDAEKNEPKQVIKSYIDPDFKTEIGISEVLSDVKQVAPAQRYAMLVGCHGLGWIPAPIEQGKGVLRHTQAAPQYKLHWDYTDEHGNPLARYFGTGGTTPSATHTDVTTLANAIGRADLHMEYILFDVCYMACVEAAYALRHVTDNIIASVSEIPARGFPYLKMGHLLLGTPDYVGICQAFGDYFKTAYQSRPHATVSHIVSDELEPLAAVVKRIYTKTNNNAVDASSVQYYDWGSYNAYFDYPTEHLFFDLGDYVRRLCSDAVLLAEFEAQLNRAVPENCRQHTTEAISGYTTIPIHAYSGIAASDPLTTEQCRDLTTSEWWQATH